MNARKILELACSGGLNLSWSNLNMCAEIIVNAPGRLRFP